MKISYRDHVTNETVLDKVNQKRKLLPMVKSRKLKYFGQIFALHLRISCLELCQASGDREANGKNGLMTLWNGQATEARQYRTWSGRQTIDWHFKDSFMRSPTLARRVRHLD